MREIGGGEAAASARGSARARKPRSPSAQTSGGLRGSARPTGAGARHAEHEDRRLGRGRRRLRRRTAPRRRVLKPLALAGFIAGPALAAKPGPGLGRRERAHEIARLVISLDERVKQETARCARRARPAPPPEPPSRPLFRRDLADHGEAEMRAREARVEPQRGLRRPRAPPQVGRLPKAGRRARRAAARLRAAREAAPRAASAASRRPAPARRAHERRNPRRDQAQGAQPPRRKQARPRADLRQSATRRVRASRRNSTKPPCRASKRRRPPPQLEHRILIELRCATNSCNCQSVAGGLTTAAHL